MTSNKVSVSDLLDHLQEAYHFRPFLYTAQPYYPHPCLLSIKHRYVAPICLGGPGVKSGLCVQTEVLKTAALRVVTKGG